VTTRLWRRAAGRSGRGTAEGLVESRHAVSIRRIDVDDVMGTPAFQEAALSQLPQPH
jgi:hypothetical protein